MPAIRRYTFASSRGRASTTYPRALQREFAFAGSDPADIEVEVIPTEITIYGWTGSVLDGIGLPVPATPPVSGRRED
jgi:hypothetical protein